MSTSPWILRGLVAAALAMAVPLRAEDAPAAAEAAPVQEEAPAEPLYIYKGDQFRDPFLPLTGGLSDFAVVRTEPGAFNPSGVEIKGLIKNATGRWALLRGASSDLYIVQNGKIFNSRRKPVEGYVGIIKEKSIVIIGPNNQVTELKLRDPEEKKKG